MSIRLMDLALQAGGMSSVEKLVLIAYANHANDDGAGIWPSNERLARQACCSVRTVQRTVSKLVDAGLITRQPGRRENGSQTSNRITINVEALTELTGASDCHPAGVGASECQGGGDTSVTPITPSLTIDRYSAREVIEFWFDQFWQAYPRKTAKKAAAKAWARLAPDPNTAEQIVADVLQRAAKDDQWTRDGGQFIPHPATYLNGERWTDQLTTTTGKHRNEKRIDVDEWRERRMAGINAARESRTDGRNSGAPVQKV